MSNLLTNELSMNRKCEQSFTADDTRTFGEVLCANKYKVPCDQTLGNDNKDISVRYLFETYIY